MATVEIRQSVTLDDGRTLVHAQTWTVGDGILAARAIMAGAFRWWQIPATAPSLVTVVVLDEDGNPVPSNPIEGA